MVRRAATLLVPSACLAGSSHHRRLHPSALSSPTKSLRARPTENGPRLGGSGQPIFLGPGSPIDDPTGANRAVNQRGPVRSSPGHGRKRGRARQRLRSDARNRTGRR
jgi:hypothetical protein